ncbi:MAG: exo-alpha-sialidase, partial [Planctomycetes bacterium]|nr:exo-alpha-sialidase [Planctomycetota bacterium]
MSKELLIATRKGLFVLRRKGRRWSIEEPAFRGVNVSMCLLDPRDGALYAALDHGHFGVKL